MKRLGKLMRRAYDAIARRRKDNDERDMNHDDVVGKAMMDGIYSSAGLEENLTSVDNPSEARIGLYETFLKDNEELLKRDAMGFWREFERYYELKKVNGRRYTLDLFREVKNGDNEKS